MHEVNPLNSVLILGSPLNCSNQETVLYITLSRFLILSKLLALVAFFSIGLLHVVRNDSAHLPPLAALELPTVPGLQDPSLF